MDQTIYVVSIKSMSNKMLGTDKVLSWKNSLKKTKQTTDTKADEMTIMVLLVLNGVQMFTKTIQ